MIQDKLYPTLTSQEEGTETPETTEAPAEGGMEEGGSGESTPEMPSETPSEGTGSEEGQM